jgi:hypothetical protein
MDRYGSTEPSLGSEFKEVSPPCRKFTKRLSALITNQLLECVLKLRALEFSGGCVCKHSPQTANHPGSFRTLPSAARSKSRNCSRISSASTVSSVTNSKATDPSWSSLELEHCAPFGRLLLTPKFHHSTLDDPRNRLLIHPRNKKRIQLVPTLCLIQDSEKTWR